MSDEPGEDHLLLVNIVNYVDRQITSILAEPIRLDLKISDTQLGLLQGPAYALLYALAVIPISRLTDRPTVNRVTVIAVCLAVWSVMTVFSGLAPTFGLLLLARAAVAAAEAGANPACLSLIASLVDRARRATATSFYMAGVSLGRLVGLVAGGLIGAAYGWRAAFFVAGMPGLLLAVIVFITMRDPRRQESGEGVAIPSMPAVMRSLAKNSSFLWISAAIVVMSFLSFGLVSFIASFFIRQHHTSLGQVGLLLGLAFGIGGTAGTSLGGIVSDRLARIWGNSHLWVSAIAAVFGGVVVIASLFTPSIALATVLLGIGVGFTSAWYGPLFGLLQSVVQPTYRATATSITIVLVTIVGNGLGPLFVGMLSDRFNRAAWLARSVGTAGPAAGLQMALAITAGVTLLAAAAMLLARRTLTGDLMKAQQVEHESGQSA